MAKYNSTHLDLTADAESMKAHMLDDHTVSVSIGTEESTAFGDSWATFVSTGVKRAEPFTVGGLFDDTATTGPDAVFNTLGTTIEFITTWGGSKTTTFDAIVTKYDRIAKVGAMTRYVATMQPTGTITEA